LDEDELRALAQISNEFEYEDGAVVAYQRDVADSLYMVRSGRLFGRAVDDRGIVRETQPYLPGDHFGDIWMFAPDLHPSTVKATGSSRVMTVKGIDFLQFLEVNPQALAKLEPDFDEIDRVEIGLSYEAWAEAKKSRLKADRQSSAVSLLSDELVEFQTRRSRWYLALRLIPPAIGFILGPTLVFSLLAGQPIGSTLYNSRWVAALILALVFILWLAFQTLDWSNDYFVITNKHLTHREFSLRTFRTTIVKIPIDQIQSVEVDRPSLIANLFNYGTARVTTAAQAGSIRFDSIDNPAKVEETLNRLRQRGRSLDAGRAQATMRQSVESHFQIQPAFELVDASEDEEEEEIEELAPQPTGLLAAWRRFRRLYRWRVEEKGVITYRKHFFVLMKEIIWPAGVGIALLLLAVIVIRASGIPAVQLVAIFLLVCLIDLGWLIWQIEDWRNDVFQLTERYVIDIDRRPFGFGESRKQAELRNVQNISSDRPNILATFFNYGNVIIETAGATSDITFESVSHPNLIQSDLFNRRDQFRQLQQVKEGENRRKEYSVLLDVYQQATEQGRIPRRTPPADA
jgi:CRP-like cAMP-binding protein